MAQCEYKSIKIQKGAPVEVQCECEATTDWEGNSFGHRVITHRCDKHAPGHLWAPVGTQERRELARMTNRAEYDRARAVVDAKLQS